MTQDSKEEQLPTLDERALKNGHKAAIVWLTGLPAAGKTTLANALGVALFQRGIQAACLDGDHVRKGLNQDLGFTPADRSENIRRVGEVARLMMHSGQVVICSFISPYQEDREFVKGLVGDHRFLEIFVNCPLEECERRDPKGHYQRARAGLLPNYTGISAPYEAPTKPDAIIDTATLTIMESVDQLLALLQEREVIPKSSPSPGPS